MFRRSKNYHVKSIVLNVLGALRVIPGGNQVDGLPPASSNGSGHVLDLARGSVTCLHDFDLKIVSPKNSRISRKA